MTGSHAPTEDDWKRFGRAVEDRRFELSLSQEALVKHGGPSHQIVRNVEKGVAADYRDTTFRKFDRALRWRDGTAYKILLGTATDEEVAEIVPRVYERAGGAAAVVTGRLDATLPGLETSATGDVSTSDLERMRFGPGERIPRRDATIVTVAELLRRLREEKERTPTMGEAEDVLVRLLPELYRRDAT